MRHATKTITGIALTASSLNCLSTENRLHEGERRIKTRKRKTNFLGQISTQMILAVAAIFILHISASARIYKVTKTCGPGLASSEPCPATGLSLSEAINAANAGPNPDSIVFEIPLSDKGCNEKTKVCTIRPVDYLWLMGPATIDGYTQDDAKVNTRDQGTNAVLTIELKGFRDMSKPTSSWWGIRLASGATVRGLIINNFFYEGVQMEGDGNEVHGCFIGTDATGTIAIPNGRPGSEGEGGIKVDGNRNLVGGSSKEDRNLISGNLGAGIRFPNLAGSSYPSNSNLITNNLIGVEANGTGPLGNGGDGIFFLNHSAATFHDNSITNNVIAFNGRTGVNIAGTSLNLPNAPQRTRIQSNSIHSNGTLGINLDDHTDDVNPNDPRDADNGANGLQNFPIITSSVMCDGNFFINGTLNSKAGGTYTIEFFANDVCETSGHGEGKTYLGQVTAADLDNDCKLYFKALFPVPPGAGKFITSTATDSAGNTSEFSSCWRADQSLDSDGDGVADLDDAFQNDASEVLDTDDDGIGNNADNDDDGDARIDAQDNCPLNPNANQLDSDGDLIGNVCDTVHNPYTSKSKGPPHIVFSSNLEGNPRNLEIFGKRADGQGVAIRLTDNPGDDIEPAMSPDRKRIAFTSTRDGNYEIYVMNVDGSCVRRLTNNTSVDRNPAWSPDGKKIVFTSNRDGNSKIYSLNVVDCLDQSGTMPNATPLNDPVGIEPICSPDGCKIAFTGRGSTGRYTVFSMNADGTGLTPLTTGSEHNFHPTWSPDGSRIAFVKLIGPTNKLYTMKSDGTDARLLFDKIPVSEPSWGPNGKIAFRSAAGQDIYWINSDGCGHFFFCPGLTRLTMLPSFDGWPHW